MPTSKPESELIKIHNITSGISPLLILSIDHSFCHSAHILASLSNTICTLWNISERDIMSLNWILAGGDPKSRKGSKGITQRFTVILLRLRRSWNGSLSSLTWRTPLPQHGIGIELIAIGMPPLMELPMATTIYDKVIKHARQYVFLVGSLEHLSWHYFLYTSHCKNIKHHRIFSFVYILIHDWVKRNLVC